MIYVRADGNSKIGMGHIMRCLAISRQLRELGETVTFLLAGEEAAPVVQEAGFATQILHTDFTHMEQEWEMLSQILPKGGKILVDSYFVTEDYLRRLQDYGKVIYVDDMDAFPYPVDAVVNGNIYGADISYQVPVVMAGCDYAPLRQEYRQWREKCDPEYVLITTGSSDPYGLTLKIVQELLRRPILAKESVKIVCGKFNQDYEKLLELTEDYPQLQVLQNVPDMWRLMSGAKAAVTAGGTTMNELSCMGVPAVCFSFVDNQERITRVYGEKGYVHFSGDYLKDKEAMIAPLCDALEELISKEVLREHYRRKASDLVDGLGSLRIARKIIEL